METHILLQMDTDDFWQMLGSMNNIWSFGMHKNPIFISPRDPLKLVLSSCHKFLEALQWPSIHLFAKSARPHLSASENKINKICLGGSRCYVQLDILPQFKTDLVWRLEGVVFEKKIGYIYTEREREREPNLA